MRTPFLIPLLATLFTLGCDKGDDTGDITDGGAADGGAGDGGTADGGASDGGAGDGGADVVELDVLKDYMSTNALDLPDVLSGWTVSPQTVFDTGLDAYFIVDIRTGDMYQSGVVDFEEGHLDGAHSVPMADVVDYVAANNTDDLPVLVVCYTGTSAAHAVMALRLSGYEAATMTWGMSGWHSDFDLWTGNLGNAALDYPSSWSTDAPPTLDTFSETPLLATGMTEGADILDAQLDARVLDGLNKVGITTVLSAPADYQVVNYWSVDDWDHYGHVSGAYQVTPGELTLDSLDQLDPSRPIVVYCWTGQTASMIAAWLQVLGYDANTMPYSANGMIYDQLESHKFSGALDLTYETGA